MRIVDAQVHIWSSGAPVAHHRQVASVSAGEMLKEMDAAGVDAAIIHPPGWDVNSNAFAIEAACAYPHRFAILGQFPLQRPENRGLIAGWKKQPGMLGLRWALTGAHEANWPTDGTMDWIWPEAERAGVPVALLAWRFLPAFRRIAEAHPQLKLILDHCGLRRPEKDAAAFADLDELLALARLPNVAVKATGAPGYSTAPYPYRNIHDGLRRIFDAFGPARFFWGTDITRMPCTYRQCVTMFTEELPWLQGSDLEMVMGRGVCEWLGWKLPASSPRAGEGRGEGS